MALAWSIQQATDPDNGVICPEIFVDPGIYQGELKKLFTRAWLFVGHESLIPQSGSAFLECAMSEIRVKISLGEYTEDFRTSKELMGKRR